jgi:hypothetical protein
MRSPRKSRTTPQRLRFTRYTTIRPHPSDAQGHTRYGCRRFGQALSSFRKCPILLEQWELANFKPQYNFVVRQYAIGKGHSVSVMWRGGEVDTIFGFEKEAHALEWIRTKSQAWLLEAKD